MPIWQPVRTPKNMKWKNNLLFWSLVRSRKHGMKIFYCLKTCFLTLELSAPFWKSVGDQKAWAPTALTNGPDMVHDNYMIIWVWRIVIWKGHGVAYVPCVCFMISYENNLKWSRHIGKTILHYILYSILIIGLAPKLWWPQSISTCDVRIMGLIISES